MYVRIENAKTEVVVESIHKEHLSDVFSKLSGLLAEHPDARLESIEINRWSSADYPDCGDLILVVRHSAKKLLDAVV